MSTNITEKFEHLSDEEMREMILQNEHLKSLSREELIAKIQADGINAQKTKITDLEIHPLSSIAIGAASPADAFAKDIEGLLWWERIGLIILFSVIIFTMIATTF